MLTIECLLLSMGESTIDSGRYLMYLLRGRGRVMDKCRYCGLKGLVLSTINADYSCEHCGKWQEAQLNSAWVVVGYER